MGHPNEPPSGFTGLPSDYPLFSVHSKYGEGATMEFCHPQGNPFFSRSTCTALALPADLSPYGRIYHTEMIRHSGPQGYQIMPVLTTDTYQSEGDQRINSKIQALVGENPGWSCFFIEMYADRVTLLASQQPEVSCGDSMSAERSTTDLRWMATWDFGTWADNPMTVEDLPQPWQETYDWYCIAYYWYEEECDPRHPDQMNTDLRVNAVWQTQTRLIAEVVIIEKPYFLYYLTD
jgi:hypothetical protein